MKKLYLIFILIILLTACNTPNTEKIEFNEILSEQELETLLVQFRDMRNDYILRLTDAENCDANIYIGQPLYCYDYYDGKVVKKDSYLYPIVLKGNLCCLAIKYTKDGVIRVALTDSLYRELTPYFYSGDKLALVYSHGCYALTDDKLILLKEEYGYEEVVESLRFEDILNKDKILLTDFNNDLSVGYTELGQLSVN